eukprot:5421441-Amphidinium_carterae.1
MDSTEKGVEWEWGSPGPGKNLCWDFSKGQCPRGDSCPYLHDASQSSDIALHDASHDSDTAPAVWRSVRPPAEEPPAKRFKVGSQPEALVVD